MSTADAKKAAKRKRYKESLFARQMEQEAKLPHNTSFLNHELFQIENLESFNPIHFRESGLTSEDYKRVEKKIEELGDRWCSNFAGTIGADGCFYIGAVSSRISTRIQLKTSMKDEKYVKSLKSLLGFGSIHIQSDESLANSRKTRPRASR